MWSSKFRSAASQKGQVHFLNDVKDEKCQTEEKKHCRYVMLDHFLGSAIPFEKKKKEDDAAFEYLTVAGDAFDPHP